MQIYSLREKILFFKYAVYFSAYMFADPANKVLFKKLHSRIGDIVPPPFSLMCLL